MKCSDKK